MPNDSRSKIDAFIDLILLSQKRGALSRLVASNPHDRALPRRLTGHATLLRGTPVLTVEASYEGARVTHQHYKEEELRDALSLWFSSYGQINLLTSMGEASCLTSKKGACTARGVAMLQKKLQESDDAPITESTERKKERILSGDEPFLVELGISSSDGRVHDKRQAKFRQINRFLEIVRDVYPHLPSDGTLVVYDLCCGKSYLSFALYHYLTAICKRTVSMLCIDLKADVIADCAQIAEKVGFSSMSFRCDDVKNTPKGVVPHLLVSLHACDTATDIVLDAGMALGAQVILSTPCCHRALSEQIACPALDFATRHPQLRTKLCEALTDALRLLRLQKNGYAVTAIELTDPENTPKNTLLRAIRTKGGANSSFARRAAIEYEQTLAFLLGTKEGEDNHS